MTDPGLNQNLTKTASKQGKLGRGGDAQGRISIRSRACSFFCIFYLGPKKRGRACGALDEETVASNKTQLLLLLRIQCNVSN